MGFGHRTCETLQADDTYTSAACGDQAGPLRGKVGSEGGRSSGGLMALRDCWETCMAVPVLWETARSSRGLTGSVPRAGQFLCVDSEADACPKQAWVVQDEAWTRPAGWGQRQRKGWVTLNPGSALCSTSGSPYP